MIVELIVGSVGALLVIIGILSAVLPNFYEFLSKTYFIESIPEKRKPYLLEKIKRDHMGTRYGVSAIVIYIGVNALMWAWGFVASPLGWPLF